MLAILLVLLALPGLLVTAAPTPQTIQSASGDRDMSAPGIPHQQLAHTGDHKAQPPLQSTPVPAEDRSRYTRGESNVKLQWDVLLDSLALLVARFWLLCGALLVGAIAVSFVVLWVKSRNLQRP